MGMPATVNVTDISVMEEDISEVFSYFHFIDKNSVLIKKTARFHKLTGESCKKRSLVTR